MLDVWNLLLLFLKCAEIKFYLKEELLMKKRTIMKKMLSMGLVGAMVLSLAACGSSSSGDSEEASVLYC